ESARHRLIGGRQPEERVLSSATETTLTPGAERSIFRAVPGALLLMLVMAAVILGCWMLYRVEAGRIADAQRQRESLRVGVMAQLLRSELRPVVDTLRLLIDGDGLRSYLENGSQTGLESAIRSAQRVSVNHPEF